MRAAGLSPCYAKVLPVPCSPPVPVLLLYSPHGGALLAAVTALADFLQQGAGCSVALDLWDQGGVAKLGPLRWLREQLERAQVVLIVTAPPPLLTSGPVVPASAQALFPLALALVSGLAERGRLCVVALGPKAPGPELRSLRCFSLMQDLDKLCRRLHGARGGARGGAKELKEKSTEKLRQAVLALCRESAHCERVTVHC